MTQPTHILFDWGSNISTIIRRFQAFERYFTRLDDVHPGCRKMIMSVTSNMFLFNPGHNHASHTENSNHVLYVHENGREDKFSEVANCDQCNVSELLCNERSIYDNLHSIVNVLNYTWFENELIVPKGRTRPTYTVQEGGQLLVIIDGYNIGNHNRDQGADTNFHTFISNIRKCVHYFRQSVREIVPKVVVILPKWPYNRKEQMRNDCTDYLIVEPNIQWVDIHKQGEKSADDRYMLEMALGKNSVIVSNDNFDDLAEEKEVWKHVIDNRVLNYSISGTQRDFELTESSPWVYRYYLSGEYENRDPEGDTGGKIDLFVDGYENNVKREDILKYVRIRGILGFSLEIFPKRNSPHQVIVRLTVLKCFSNLLQSPKFKFWPRSIRCKRWGRHPASDSANNN